MTTLLEVVLLILFEVIVQETQGLGVFLFVVGVVIVCVWFELRKTGLSYASKSTFYLHEEMAVY